MTATTPRGTRTREIRRPLGRTQPSRTSPTGSASDATWRRPRRHGRHPGLVEPQAVHETGSDAVVLGRGHIARRWLRGDPAHGPRAGPQRPTAPRSSRWWRLWQANGTPPWHAGRARGWAWDSFQEGSYGSRSLPCRGRLSSRARGGIALELDSRGGWQRARTRGGVLRRGPDRRARRGNRSAQRHRPLRIHPRRHQRGVQPVCGDD